MGFGDITNCFSEIASAIRSKTGGSGTYTPSQMAGAINGISTGVDINSFGIQTDNASVYVNTNIFSASRINSQMSDRFNQPVTIPNRVTDASNMFYGCHNFNQPVNIPNSVTNTSHMFGYCYRFSQPITVPNSVVDASNMFCMCNTFNQSVTMSNGVTNTVYMFYECSNFNKPVIIPNSVTNTAYMFMSCYNFNQLVNIPNSVTNTAYMFHGCEKFNKPVTIPNSVTNASYMFCFCNYMFSDIQILHAPTDNIFAINLLGSAYNNKKRINIYHTGEINRILECYNGNRSNRIWITNTSNKCQYNTVLNIYIYYNQTL